jgi:hypothetical protein
LLRSAGVFLVSDLSATMTIWNVVGYRVSALVLLAFYQKRMIPLRAAALASNVAFIACGLALGLAPVRKVAVRA